MGDVFLCITFLAVLVWGLYINCKEFDEQNRQQVRKNRF